MNATISLENPKLQPVDISALSDQFIRDLEPHLANVAKSHPRSDVRRSALVALRRIDSSILRELSLIILATEADNENLRETAIKNLGQVGAPEDLAILEELAHSESIARFGQPAARNAIAELKRGLLERDSLALTENARFRFDVALSFAGEDRETAEQLRDALVERDLTVFYDMDYSAQLIGEDLSGVLGVIYSQASRFCIMIISRYYSGKPWPDFERTNIQERSRFGGGRYIIPVRLDDSKVEGVPNTIGHIDLRNMNATDAAALVAEKVELEKRGESLTRR